MLIEVKRSYNKILSLSGIGHIKKEESGWYLHYPVKWITDLFAELFKVPFYKSDLTHKNHDTPV